MERVMHALGGRRPDQPARWRWGIALAVLTGAGGLGWLYVNSQTGSGTAFAEAPIPTPPTTGEQSALQQALPLLTTSPALPAIQSPPNGSAQRDPFAAAPQRQTSSGGRDPFAPTAVAADAPGGPWTPRAEANNEEPRVRPAILSRPIDANTASESPVPVPSMHVDRRFPQNVYPVAEAGRAAPTPALQQVQATEPAVTQDLFFTPPDPATPPALAPLTPPQGATDDLSAPGATPVPVMTPPANNAPFSTLAPPIEERMQAPPAEVNPFAPATPSAPEIPAANPFPAQNPNETFTPTPAPAASTAPTESFFPSAATPAQPEPTPLTPPYQPVPAAEAPFQNSQPLPLESTSRPLLSPTPATAASATAALADEQVYKVQSGDNYWSISKAFYGSGRYFGALAEYNRHRIPSPEKMKPGMIVLVPDALVLHRQFPKLAGPDPSQVKPEEPSGFFVDPQGNPAYRVGEGDTLGGIAQLHLGRFTRAEQVYNMNKDRIRDPNNLQLGTILRLPADASQVQIASDR